MKRKILSSRQQGEINSILNIVNKEEKESKSFEDFIDLIREDTLAAFNQIDFSTLGEDVEWDIVGVEFRLSASLIDEKYQTFSDEVRKQAFEATTPLGLRENSSWLYEHDFANSDIKLGCLVHEFVSASPLLDLGYFMELLKSQGVPSYIEEDCKFHINAEEPEQTPMPKMRTIH